MCIRDRVYTSEEYDEMVDTQWTGGIVGYSLAEKDLPKKGEARDLIKYASKFLGNIYVWGCTCLLYTSSSAFSIKNSLSENIQKMCPADVQITVGKEVKNDVINNKQVKVKSIFCLLYTSN